MSITLLGQLATAVTATGEDLWYTGDTSDLAPQVEEALDTYVDESHAKAVAVLPLVPPLLEEETALTKRIRNRQRSSGH